MTLVPTQYEYPSHSKCVSVCESHYNKCKVMAKQQGPKSRSSLAKRMHSFMNVALVTCSIRLAVTSFLHFFRRLCQPVVAVDCFMCGVWAAVATVAAVWPPPPCPNCCCCSGSAPQKQQQQQHQPMSHSSFVRRSRFDHLNRCSTNVADTHALP